MALIIDENGFKNQMEVLRAASTMSGEMGQRLREAIFKELKAARNRIVGDIHFANGDPRDTAHAVKRYVAKKYLGGVVSILDDRQKSGGTSTYEAPRKVYPGRGGQRGGNRMVRSQRTQDILSYPGVDRGFILRFVNSGTNPRYSGGGRVELRGSSARNFFKMQEQGDNYRGSIAPRNFFGTAGEREIQKAIENLSTIIDEEYSKIFRE